MNSSQSLSSKPIKETQNHPPQLKDFHYQVLGNDSSPKLVFLHGVLGKGRNWYSLAKKFSQTHQCLLFDQRGHGLSMKPTWGYQLEDYALDVKQILTGLGWNHKPLYLVGHSLGAQVALLYACQFREKSFQKLILVDMGLTNPHIYVQDILEKIDFVPTPFPTRNKARNFMYKNFQAKYKNQILTNFFYTNLSPTPQGGVNWTFSPRAIKETLKSLEVHKNWHGLELLQHPTLLIRGENSNHLGTKDFHRALDLNPHIQGALVPGAGHWIHSEKPEETFHLIKNFLQIDETLKSC